MGGGGKSTLLTVSSPFEEVILQFLKPAIEKTKR